MGRPTKYPEEFRRDAVELCRTSGRPIADVARSLGITDTTLHNWLKLIVRPASVLPIRTR